MIICKRPASPDDDLLEATTTTRVTGGLTRVPGVTLGDGRQGGEERKGEEGKGYGGEEIFAGGRTDGWTNQR